MTNKEIFGFDVFAALRAGDVSILCQGKGTHVVLINNIGVDFVALCFKKLTSPKNIADFVVETDQFAFARTLSWSLVFRG